MKTIRLEIASVKRLDQIRDALLNRRKLNEKQTEDLVDFISDVLSTAKEFADGVIRKTELNPSIELQIADTRSLLIHLRKWRELFKKLPGMEYGPDVHLNNKFIHEHDFSHELMTGSFYPTLAHKRRGHGSNRFTFSVDGTAEFKILEPEQFPELASFKGSWEGAYLALAKVMKENWPQEPFPEELEKLFAK